MFTSLDTVNKTSRHYILCTVEIYYDQSCAYVWRGGVICKQCNCLKGVSGILLHTEMLFSISHICKQALLVIRFRSLLLSFGVNAG